MRLGIVIGLTYFVLAGTPAELSAQSRGLVPLLTWYSDQRGDHFTTTDREWRADVGTIRPGQGTYRALRIEGYVFSPEEPQPPNTVPLYNWWSSRRQDNLLTTDPEWSGDIGTTRPGQGDYELFRIEGYVFDSPRMGTVPLHQLWHGPEQDNWTTSHPLVDGRPGSPVGRVTPVLVDAAYQRYRIGGYLLPPGPTDNPDFGEIVVEQRFGMGRLRNRTREIPVLVVMNDWADLSFTRHSREDYRAKFSGPGEPNIRAFASTASSNRFTFRLVDVVRVRSDQTIAEANTTSTPALRRAALTLADRRVEFRVFDSDRDGIVTSSELQVVRYGPCPESCMGGQNGVGMAELDGVTVRTSVNLVAEDTPATGILHELLHSLGAEDLYGPGRLLNASASVMAAMPGGNRLFLPDAWHMTQFGWARPTPLPMPAYPGAPGRLLRLRYSPIGAPVILYDPTRSGEYFMLEHRSRDPHGSFHYDSGVVGSGLLVWHVLIDDDRSLRTIRRASGSGTVDRADRVAWPTSSPADAQVQGVLALGRDGRLGVPTAFDAPGQVPWLRWFDGTDTGIRLRVVDRGGEFLTVSIERDGNSAPRLDRAISSRAPRGSRLTLTGEFPETGTWDAIFTPASERTSAGRTPVRVSAEVVLYGATMMVPDVVSGEYDVVVVPRGEPSASSRATNAIRVAVP